MEQNESESITKKAAFLMGFPWLLRQTMQNTDHINPTPSKQETRKQSRLQLEELGTGDDPTLLDNRPFSVSIKDTAPTAIQKERYC